MQKAIIRLENISLENERVSLRGITLSVYPKEIYVLTSDTSANKTTLLKICLGLIQPQNGKVYIGDYNVTNATYHQLINYRHKLQISCMSYPSILISNRSILQNILLPLKYHSPNDRDLSKKAQDVISLLGLKGYENKMPYELLDEEKRRVDLARAIITQPRIIFYNQPLYNFDLHKQQEIIKIIEQFPEKTVCTSIIITNNWQQFIKMTNRIGVLSNGQLLYSGTPDGLYASDNTEIQQFISNQKEVGFDGKKE